MAAAKPGDVLARGALELLRGATLRAAARQAGHGDGAAFDKALVRRYGVSGAALRHLPTTGRYVFAYGGPFHLERTLAYLGRDKENVSEQLEGNRFTRWFPAGGRAVRVTLALGERECAVTLHGRRLAPGAYLELHGALRRFLGLEQPLGAFYRQVRDDPVMGPLTTQCRGVRIPQVPTLWEALCWAIMGQQINLAFAYRLRNRVIRLANGRRNGPGPLPFPTAEQVLRLSPETLRENQFSRQKSAYLGIVARACLEGPLRDLSLARTSAEEAEQALLSVKGLGRWSTAYGMMRGLGYMDALPVGDTGLRSALQARFGLAEPPDIRRQEELMEPYRPYRSLATYYLWRSQSAPATD
jgi:3-methyladenine DNA glycosylase/8-oxoguanine DNA glycosylase